MKKVYATSFGQSRYIGTTSHPEQYINPDFAFKKSKTDPFKTIP
jgi:hypothetical protein